MKLHALPEATARPPGTESAEGTSRLLTGWGRTAPSRARVLHPGNDAELGQDLAAASERGSIARGLGRSYGDAAQNGGGTVLLTERLNRLIDLDAAAGFATVQAGLSLDDLMRVSVPRGWFPPVSPGTRQVTIGGAIAADIHGKNHHRDGSFTQHVRRLALRTPAGLLELTPEADPDAFWATAGGMGLTGVIEEATLAMHPVRTSRIRMDTERATDLDDAFARMQARDHLYRYSVAWIDCLGRGAHLGRSVLTRGAFAEPGELPVNRRADPLRYRPRTLLAAPPWVPGGLVNRLTVSAFNEVWFRKAPRQETGRIVPLEAFFHPLDGVKGWNRMYGPSGFLQYQFVVPFGSEAVVRTAITRLGGEGMPSFLAVLKRFGPHSPGHLSFPIEGWTLALDIPVGRPALGPILDALDEEVAGAGGRVYLAKDSRTRPELIPAMYPRLADWRRVQARLDPKGTMQSDLSRRLGLTRQ